MCPLRVLLLADTHLGFDLPWKPRVERRRRGPDFFANYERALRPALAGEVDLVMHGGDVLYRSKVRPQLVRMAFEPLMRVADGGVPVVVVPGNHERSTIPYPLFAAHPGIHIIQGPRTVCFQLAGLDVAVAGFPHQRGDVRSRFTDLVEATGWRGVPADVRLLAFHQTVEGARVGPVGYTFRRGHDIVRGRDIPAGFAAVLAGHIHRYQVLRKDLAGRLLAAPVFYPGSIERTSTAERDETKGFLTLDLAGDRGGKLVGYAFHEVPARPMIDVDLKLADFAGRDEIHAHLRDALGRLNPDAVVRVRVQGEIPAGTLSTADLRRLAAPTMTISLSVPRPR